MNFIVDEQLPPQLARWIAAQAGCTASHVFDFGLKSNPDDLICDTIQRTGAILVTKDDDFVVAYGEMVDRMIWVRCGNLVNSKLLALVEANRDRVINELATRKLVEIR